MSERVGQLTDNLVTIKENLPGYRGRAMTHASIISRTFLAEIHDLSGIKIPLATLGMRPAENVSGVGWGPFRRFLWQGKSCCFCRS